MDEDRLEQLEGRVKELKVRLESLEDDVELSDAQGTLEELLGDQEKNDDRLELLEERVAVLNVQSIELRDHLNTAIQMVNSITRLLNKAVNNKEITDTPPQLTVQQVYDMYPTHPSTEEGWQEMTDAIRAAEEHEAEQKLLNSVNHRTDNDLDNGLLQLQ